MAATLYDADGYPIDFDALRRSEATAQVAGVRQILSGHPSVALNPARLGAILRAAENGDATAYLELAEDIEEKDWHYRAVLGTRRTQVSQLAITVEAASDDPSDIADADLVREVLADAAIEFALFDLLDAVGKSYAVVEIEWATDGPRWLPKAYAWRDPRWFAFDPADGTTLRLRDGAGLRPLAPYKFIRHVHRSKSGLPIRGGLARAAAWSWMFKSFALKDWIAFAEIYGLPFRIGKYPASADDKAKAALLRAVSNISHDAAAIIPEGTAIEFVESQSRSQSDFFERIAEYFDRQTSKLVLGQTATTDAIAGGHAVGQEHNDVRGDIERSDAMQLGATLNRDLVRPIVDLNRGPRARYPRVRVGRPEEKDVARTVDAVAKLVPLGLKVEQSVMRDLIGLPDPEAGADLLVPPAAPPPMDSGQLALQAQDAARRAPADPIAPIADKAEAAIAAATGDMIERVRALLDDCATLDEFRDRLLDLYPTLDAKGIAEAMSGALALASLQGRADILSGA